MLSPIKWIKPRLRSLCVAFGVADMTLVLLSALCWYLTFNAAFEAQHIQSLFRSQHKDDDPTQNDDGNGEVEKKKFKEDRSVEELRLERTIRACGYIIKNNQLDESVTDSNYAGPAALIGAAMGSYFILGALLATLNSVDHPAARKVICAVAIFGEGVASFFLFVGVAILSTNDGLCRTEYYYERFQPVLYLLVFTMIFLFTYKTYEVTIIAFYFGEQTTEATVEKNEVHHIKRHSISKEPPDLKDLKPLSIPKEKAAPKPVKDDTIREISKDKGAQGDVGDHHPPHRRRRSNQEDRSDHGHHEHVETGKRKHSHDSGGKGVGSTHRDENETSHRSQRKHFRQIPEQGDHHHHDHHHHETSEQRKRRQPNPSGDGDRHDRSEEHIRAHAGHVEKNEHKKRKSHYSHDSKGHRHHKEHAEDGGGDGEGGSSAKHKSHHHPLHPTKHKPSDGNDKDHLANANSIEV